MYEALWVLGCCRHYVTCTFLALIRKVYIYMNLKLYCMAKTNYGWKCYERTGGSVMKAKLLYPFFFPFHHIHSSIRLSSCGLFILPFFSSVLWQLCLSSDHCCISSDRLLRSLSHLLPLLSSHAFIKPQMGCHASPSSLACPVWKARPFRGDGGMRKRPEHSTREEGWPLCLHLPGATAPLRHWCGITVPERSRDRESAGGRWTREKSQAVLRANPQEFGVFSLFDHILEPLNDVFEPKCSDPWIPNVEVNSA